MVLAHNCVICGIGVNVERLYAGADPDYETVLRVLVDNVHATKSRS